MQVEAYRRSKVTIIPTVDLSVLGGPRMQIGSIVWDDTLRCNAKIRSGLIDIKILIEVRARFGFGSVNSQQQFGSR
jgi:hypothetical protein